MSTLWAASSPLLLASASAIRRDLLQRAGIPVEVRPASIDERAAEASLGAADARAVARHLACEKALAVSRAELSRLVLGADQTLALGARRFSKPAELADARAQLLALRGKTHELHSGFALAQGGTVLCSGTESASLRMREFSERFLDAYLSEAGDAVRASVGGYQLEGLGIQLFERVEGSSDTILGLPLLPVLAFLRAEGVLLG